jgi:hypothetical protein
MDWKILDTIFGKFHLTVMTMALFLAFISKENLAHIFLVCYLPLLAELCLDAISAGLRVKMRKFCLTASFGPT